MHSVNSNSSSGSVFSSGWSTSSPTLWLACKPRLPRTLSPHYSPQATSHLCPRCIWIMLVVWWLLAKKAFFIQNFVQPAREARRACALRALGLLLGDSAPTLRRGKTFWAVNRVFLKETAVTQERKIRKSFPRWKRNRHSEGYKQAVDQNWGRVAKIRFLFKEKRCPNNYHLKYLFRKFFGLKPIFRPKTTFRPNIKTSASP